MIEKKDSMLDNHMVLFTEEFKDKVIEVTFPITRGETRTNQNFYFDKVVEVMRIGELVWKDYRDKYNNSDKEHHGIEHIREVLLLSFKLCVEYEGKLDGIDFISSLYMCTIASITHDSHSYENRENHHELASLDVSSYLSSNKLRNSIPNIDNKFISIVSSMVFEHRASYKGEYSYRISELFSVADRGVPNFKEIIKRSCLCNMSKSNFKLEVNKNIGKTTYGKFYFENSINFQGELEDYEIFTILHMVDKFGKDGYIATNLKKDSIYKKYFNVEISFLYSDILELVNASNIKECLSNVLQMN